MNQIKWHECEIPDRKIIEGALHRFHNRMEKALKSAGWPEHAAVFSGAGISEAGLRLWITSPAAEAAMSNGFIQWKGYYIKDLPEAPFKHEATLLLGKESSWTLLRDRK